MAELPLETVREAFSGMGKNVLKIRKYVRDNQASLTAYSTNQLNRTLKEFLPAGMLLKRNYGHLALRSVGKVKTEVEPEEEPQPAKKLIKKKPKEVVEYEYEYEEEETPKQVARRPQYEETAYAEPRINYNLMSNADIARQCFMPAAMSRYRNRQW